MVSALPEEFRAVLIDVARSQRLPNLDEPKRVGPLLERLSAAYNQGIAVPTELLAARLAFSFPRDVPKAEGAVRELVALGGLRFPEGRALRVLDVGAGLGAMTAGIARALAPFATLHDEIDATWIDADRAAMDLGRKILEKPRLFGVKVSVKLQDGDAQSSLAHKRGPFDLILCGQVMSELDVDLPEEARAEKHATWLASAADLLAEDGSLVIVEPALSGRTRHLHAVRDRILSSTKLGVFAPCLHRNACPALTSPNEWCHEDLPVDLPPWLVPLARAAGLRWQGLTFSYLVLRRDALTLRAAANAGLRVTSARLVSKGKMEVFLCGELAGGVDRAKVQRLDRDENDANRALDEIIRGDLLAISPTPAARGRIGPDMHVKCTRFP